MNENVRKILNSEEGNVKFQAIDFLLERNYIKMEELEDYYAQKSNSFFLEAFWERYQKNINLERWLDFAIKYKNRELILVISRLPRANLDKIEKFLLSMETSPTLIAFAQIKRKDLDEIVKKVIEEYKNTENKEAYEWYLLKLAYIPNIDIKPIEKALIENCKDLNNLFELAIVPGTNVKVIKDVFIEYGNELVKKKNLSSYQYANLLVKFASKVPNTNIEEIENTLFKVTSERDIIMAFATNVLEANLERIINYFIKESQKNNKAIWNFNPIFLELAKVASKHGDIKSLNLCINELLDISKKGLSGSIEGEILSNAPYLYDLSKLPGVDTIKLEDAIIQTQDWYYIMLYAKENKEVNIQRIEKLMCETASTDTLISFAICASDLDVDIIMEELYKREDALTVIDNMLTWKHVNYTLELIKLSDKLKERRFSVESFVESAHELSPEKLDEMFLNEPQKLVRKGKNKEINANE